MKNPPHKLARPLRELLAQFDGAPQIRGNADLAVTGITQDSRAVEPGGMFVAVRGAAADGHRFIGRAVAAGAAVVVVEEMPAEPVAATVLVVPDTRRALAQLAEAYFGFPSQRLKLIGVTGTNGKTTTTHLIRSVIHAMGKRCGLVGTICYDAAAGAPQESPNTTPEPVLLRQVMCQALEGGAEYFVMEVSSHALHQGRCDELDFDVAVFTNLSGDHLDYHGTMQAYAEAKALLFDRLKPSAAAVVNVDDAFGPLMLAQTRARQAGFGLGDQAAYRARSIASTIDGSRFELAAPEGTCRIDSGFIGEHNVMNLLAAFVACRCAGIDAATVAAGLHAAGQVRGRLERVTREGDIPVFVDYAHTDDGLRAVLSALRPLVAGRLICVFGCGGDRDITKRPRMGKVVSELADMAVVTNDNPRTEDPLTIARQIIPGMTGPAEQIVELDRDRAIGIAIEEARSGDVVLIAGKGHETYQIFGTERRHFDDVECARQHLARRGLWYDAGIHR